ncbi:hypothetical protein E2C01_014948 [Portunus trituberculatus]|uniref:Uncharacterized protein n=1 Tax=Portunus trituberculatus TaxID=210409 RepID=A0A5B7DLM6_PORTR|nr:hypothetical protein [Portunus trituberculatus]
MSTRQNPFSPAPLVQLSSCRSQGPEATPALPFTQRDREELKRTPIEPPHPHNGHLLSRKTLKQTMIKYLVWLTQSAHRVNATDLECLSNKRCSDSRGVGHAACDARHKHRRTSLATAPPPVTGSLGLVAEECSSDWQTSSGPHSSGTTKINAPQNGDYALGNTVTLEVKTSGNQQLYYKSLPDIFFNLLVKGEICHPKRKLWNNLIEG